MKITFIPSVFICLFLSSCAATSRSHLTPANIKYDSSVPEKAFQSPNPNHITFGVVGINDFHGHLLPKERKLPDGRIVKSGGAAVLTRYLQILNKELNGRLLIVDAGDEWQGTLESNQVKGQTVVEYFNKIKLNVAAIGNHEFDFDLNNLKKMAKLAKYPYVASNIYEKKDGKRVNWPNVYPSKVFDVQGFKFGVIGVSTVDTPKTTRYDVVKHLEFRNAYEPVIEQSKTLKSGGAHLVLVTAHAGTQCEDNGTLKTWALRETGSPQGNCADLEISRLIHSFQNQEVDGVIAGHTHQIMHHFLNKVPVIQDEAYNQYFNVIYFTFDKTTKKPIPELTRIEGVIPICDRIFKGLNHCDTRWLSQPIDPKIELVQNSFHGEPVIGDPKILKWLRPIEKSTEKYRRMVVGHTGLPLEHPHYLESSFGNLVADALKTKGRADFALVNWGGIRTTLDSGPITFDALYRALPFDNLLNVVTLTGAEVRQMMEIGFSGANRYASVAGLKIKVKSPKSPGVSRDLNQDGKDEPWETKRIVSIVKSDGSELKEHETYRVATFDFILNGGDNFAWFMSKINPSKVDTKQSGYCRDIVAAYLKRAKQINTPERPLVDSKNPRVTIED